LLSSVAVAAGPAAGVEKKALTATPNVELLGGASLSFVGDPVQFRGGVRAGIVPLHLLEGAQLIGQFAFSHGGPETAFEFLAGVQYHRVITGKLSWFAGLATGYAHARFIEPETFSGYTLTARNAWALRLGGGLAWQLTDRLRAQLEILNIGIFAGTVTGTTPIGSRRSTWFDYSPSAGLSLAF
jgi:hypothetical protein